MNLYCSAEKSNNPNRPITKPLNYSLQSKATSNLTMLISFGKTIKIYSNLRNVIRKATRSRSKAEDYLKTSLHTSNPLDRLKINEINDLITLIDDCV